MWFSLKSKVYMSTFTNLQAGMHAMPAQADMHVMAAQAGMHVMAVHVMVAHKADPVWCYQQIWVCIGPFYVMQRSCSEHTFAVDKHDRIRLHNTQAAPVTETLLRLFFTMSLLVCN